MKPGAPRGKEPPGESDQLAERRSDGVCEPGNPGHRGLGGDKDWPSRAANVIAQNWREAAVPGQRLRHPGPSKPRFNRQGKAVPLLSAALTGSRFRPRTLEEPPPSPCPSPAGRPGRQLLGLEPRSRRRLAPNGRAGTRRAASSAPLPAACQPALEQLASAPALQFGAAHPQATYPVPHHPRGLRRSGPLPKRRCLRSGA